MASQPGEWGRNTLGNFSSLFGRGLPNTLQRGLRRMINHINANTAVWASLGGPSPAISVPNITTTDIDDLTLNTSDPTTFTLESGTTGQGSNTNGLLRVHRPGVYQVEVYTTFDSNTTGNRILQIRQRAPNVAEFVLGSTLTSLNAGNTTTLALSMIGIHEMDYGDYSEFWPTVFQGSGGALNVQQNNTRFRVVRYF